MTGQLTGKGAVITGSDSGIGRGTAVEFAKEGADVVVQYCEDEAGAEYVTGSTYAMDGGLMQNQGQGA